MTCTHDCQGQEPLECLRLNTCLIKHEGGKGENPSPTPAMSNILVREAVENAGRRRFTLSKEQAQDLNKRVAAQQRLGSQAVLDPVSREVLNAWWMGVGLTEGFKWTTVEELEYVGPHGDVLDFADTIARPDHIVGAWFTAEPEPVARVQAEPIDQGRALAVDWVAREAVRLGGAHSDTAALRRAFEAGHAAAKSGQEIGGKPPLTEFEKQIGKVEWLPSTTKFTRQPGPLRISTGDPAFNPEHALLVNGYPFQPVVDRHSGEHGLTEARATIAALTAERDAAKEGWDASFGQALHNGARAIELERERDAAREEFAGLQTEVLMLRQLIDDATPAVRFVNSLAAPNSDEMAQIAKGYEGPGGTPVSAAYAVVSDIRWRARHCLGDDGFRVPPTYTEAQREAAYLILDARMPHAKDGGEVAAVVDLIATALGMRKAGE